MTFPLTLTGDFIFKMTDEELERFSRQNKTYKFEKTSEGSLVVNEPTFSITSRQNNQIAYQLTKWNEATTLGECFDSNAGFYLPDKSLLSPDAAWINGKRYAALSESDRKGFFRICPDFIVELKSETDSRREQKSKMQLWMKNGCRLGWLIDTKSETVYIYTEGNIRIHRGFNNPVSGEPVLPGFELVLSKLR